MLVTEIADKILRQQKRDNPVVLFLGAGASVSSGIPTTNGLIEYIRNSSKFDYLDIEDQEGYFSLMNRIDQGDRNTLISEFINKAEVNITHLITGQLLYEGLVDYVLTTNFDSLLKKSTQIFPSDVKIYDVVNYKSLVGLKLQIPSITYLHGEYREGLQLNTKKEIEQNRNVVENVISQLAAKDSTWIVIGYSGTDLVFEILAKVQSFKQKLYWVSYKEEPPHPKVKNELLSVAKKNTQLVSGYDSDSFFEGLFNEIVKKGNFDRNELKTRIKSLLINPHIKIPDTYKSENIRPNYQISLNSEAQKWIKEFGSEFEKSERIDEATDNTSLNLGEKLTKIFSVGSDGIFKLRKLIRDKNFENALNYSNELIKEKPEEALFYYYKGVVLGELATEIEIPENRTKYYQEMLHSFNKAEVLSSYQDTQSEEIDRIDAVRKVIWQTEHNRAIELVTEEDFRKLYINPKELAISHLNNATTMQPNSVLSWDVKAQVHYMNDDPASAVASMEQVMKLKDKAKTDDYARMAGYYSLADMPEKAMTTLEKGLEAHPDNKDLSTRLADAYTNAGETQKAIAIIESLIETEPENPQFHLVLGTQIYKTVLQMSDTLKTNSNKIVELQQQAQNAQGSKASQLKQQISELEEENQQLQQRITSLTERATKELNTVLEYRPNDATAYNTLGIIYQNKASALFDKRNRTQDNRKAAEIDTQAKEALKQAMKYYESAAEIDPENKEYWKNLFSIYTALGMDKKAEEALEKAGKE